MENSLAIIDGGGLTYSSIRAETDAEKKKLFNIMNGDHDRLADLIGKSIKLQNIFVEVVELEKKDENGNPVLDDDGNPILNSAPRIVLVDDKGKGYQCVSNGIFSSVKKLMFIYGEMPWKPAIEIEVKQINKGSRRVLTLSVV